MQIFKSGLIHKAGILVLALIIVVFGTSIIDKKFHLFTRISNLPGEIAGVIIQNTPPDKFLSTVSLVGAQASAPYQNVSGDVAISGKVGIGTANPQSLLNVNGVLTLPNGDTGGGGRLQFLNGNSDGAGIWQANNGILYIKGSPVTAGVSESNKVIFIRSDLTAMDTIDLYTGNVGIGTMGPAAQLDIYKYTATLQSGPTIRLTRDYTGSDYGSAIYSGWDGARDILVFGVSSNADPASSGQERMVINQAGNVGIGTASPVAKLDVVGAIHSSNTATGFYLGAGCWIDNWLRLMKSTTGGCPVADYHDLAVGQFWSNGATRFDLAEVTPAKETDHLEQGDVVVVDQDGSTGVTKSAKAYDPTIYGIVSSYDQAALVIGGDTAPELAKKTTNRIPVALVGRVKAKVSLENGPIKVGDYLTTSSTLGVAMKASRPGPVVGKALESYSGSGVGKIMAFVNVSWYDPDVDLASTNNFQITDSGDLKGQDNTLISRIGAFAEIIVGKLRVGIIETQRLIVSGVDILEKLNALSQKVDAQQKEIDSLKAEIEQLKAK